jgi:murein DD-endopeptidase MepM/ murein hydrolase activator NlpD
VPTKLRGWGTRTRRLAIAFGIAVVLAPVALAVAGVDLFPGRDANSVRGDRSEPQLGGSELARAPRTTETAPRRSSGAKVVPLGGRQAPPQPGGEDEPPPHILEENAELRRELDHLKALERERRRVARLLESAGAVYGPFVQGSGQLAWPVAGSVVSPFGQRWGRLHAGIDIAARAGTVIYAAEAGRVVIAGWVGGYGRYVCLQHTRRLTSCYAHLSRFMTRRGEILGQGEPVGLVGCTGHCFGDHLHFETWVAGRPVDPMRFL